MNTFAENVISFYTQMDRSWKLPKGFELIDPFGYAPTVDVFSQFYNRYFNDTNERYMLLGINPGRHGAGVTGIPFTDPKILAEECGIDNEFKKMNELSAIFVYDFISQWPSIEEFYSKFYINSVCPLGFIKDGINCNYYDDKILFQKVKKHIVAGIKEQINFGINTSVAYCMGNGKNFKFLSKLNDEHHFFEEIIPLPHPRWVMQYRRKRKDEFVEMYFNALTKTKR